MEEWIPLFDDPLLAQSAIDRLAHNAYQVVMDGPSYRDKQRPDRRDGDDPPSRPRTRRKKRSR